ncbi:MULTISPECIES: 8-amino-7-oxononanoate synthase [Bacillaceae]|uniref:8-amino-7-oxononanoate synthase n=1 Tax=Bacillaceae TaxID=186817 RepID=UPI001E54BB1C|nr:MULTISPECIES: 8-amino-7-oxononanoate synthase [Bacillaceae]MCE4050186.1 8-amino-7-oxononanoate synthase [Bacillus sp. Au-Bac7]MCM3029420.1 8-amino-7-oxononanoate synthase [Niallia sp. MER 6]MDL0435275.1 8-amino-7-oxononanoate synthase [Niallia sp. SS-2023]UPO86966.1 8-amino-7-oxononanoate synthase [Niallia sp. Man26]
MKKLVWSLLAVILIVSLQVKPAEAAYLPEYDKYVEVTYDQARQIADLLGMKNIPLGEQTAKITFDVQEKVIAKIEKIIGKEIDHYYIWLTVDGQPVLGIDPPIILA